MKYLCFVVMMLAVGTSGAAGLQQLFDSFKKPPVTAPQPQAPKTPAPPQPPKSPTK